MEDTMIGVDLAKLVFQVHGASMTGQVKFTKEADAGAIPSNPPALLCSTLVAAPVTGRGRWKRLAMTSNSSRRGTSGRSSSARRMRG